CRRVGRHHSPAPDRRTHRHRRPGITRGAHRVAAHRDVPRREGGSAMSPLWSYALGALGVLGIWLAGRKSAWGWAVGFGAQFLWLTYALVTQQYGFVLTAVAYGAVYARNWWRWTHEPAVTEAHS